MKIYLSSFSSIIKQMKRNNPPLPQILRAYVGILAALMPLVGSPAARADQQNILPALTDDTAWVLKKLGRADATVSYNNEGMVVRITAADGQPSHIEIDHPGVSLTEDKIYLLSFEGRSDGDLALTVRAASDAPKSRSLGLNQTIYLTPQWTPFRLTFTAHDVVPNHSIVPQFLLGRQTGTVFLRNASLVPLAEPPPPDAGLPDVIPPRRGEMTLNGSLRTLLPNGQGFVMWVTSRDVPGRPGIIVEPPQLRTVLWARAKAFLGSKPLALREIRVGDLVSVVGASVGSGARLTARQIQVSHGLKPSLPAP